MITNCLLCGVGGQGVVLASKLIAFAAMEKGQHARTTDTIGMAQRGGSVVSHARIGDMAQSPIIPQHTADVILAFEPGEAVRALPFLKAGGIMIVNWKAVKPVTATLGDNSYTAQAMLDFLEQQVENLFVVDGDAICAKCGSAKVLNVALLGAAAQSGALGITLAEMDGALQKYVPQKFYAMNQQALQCGAEIMKK